MPIISPPAISDLKIPSIGISIHDTAKTPWMSNSFLSHLSDLFSG
ncbi:MAG: hypothetical protein Q8942_14715 [Bacillota bacterium]|nr:hypothetical protein [Bacillota bacterium]